MGKIAEIAGCLILSCAPLSAAAQPAGAEPFLAFGQTADAPSGFVEMCQRDPSSCGLAEEQPAPIHAACATADGQPAERARFCIAEAEMVSPTGSIAAGRARAAATAQAERNDAMPSPRKLVRSVNADVNRSVFQASDRALFGVDELWRPAGSGDGAAGDCEDIALQKRNELIAAGFPQDKMFLAVVYKSGLGLHTVLVARLPEGDFVLDSLNSRLRPWYRSEYSWLRLQVPDRPRAWTRVANG